MDLIHELYLCFSYMMSISASSSSKSSSLEEELKNDLNSRFGSMVLTGLTSPTDYFKVVGSMTQTLPSLIRCSGDPVTQREIDDFTMMSKNSSIMRQIIRCPRFSIHDANISRRNMIHLNCIVLLISRGFIRSYRNSVFACYIADFLMEKPIVPNQEIIYLRNNRLTTNTTHKKIRVAQIANTLQRLGHLDDVMKEHLIGWYESDPDNIANMTSLYIQPNVHRVYLEANHIPVRDMEIGCPLFVFLKPYFDHKEGVNSPGLKIVKEMSTRFFDSYHI